MEENENRPNENLEENKKFASDIDPTIKNEFSLDLPSGDYIWLASQVNNVKASIKSFIVGQEELVELLVAGIFCSGHILLEGVPGVAKTLASKVLAKALSVDFSRIQFTPDLMPSDVIGTSVFNMKESSFTFKKGPIFSNIVLIDEINRAPAKTQAALFEVMEERQITYDGKRYVMDNPFIVIATQNPIEQEGTYNLPEAQLDRFLFKIILDYPDLNDEIEILNRFKSEGKMGGVETIQPVLTQENIKKIQQIVDDVKVEENIIKYIANLTHKTRTHHQIYLGASPRGSLAIMRSAKAIAAIRGRDFITPDDVQYVAPHVLNHRLILTPEAEMEGLKAADLINEITKEVEVPR
jgi:MoxR-like ATPase